MPIRAKADGSGSAEPNLLDSVNNPNDFSVPTWRRGKLWVQPGLANADGSGGSVNFASVANGIPVWDGTRLWTETGALSLQEFFERNNVPEADRDYLRAKLNEAYDEAQQAVVAETGYPAAAFVNCSPWWCDQCVCVRPGSSALPVSSAGALRLRVRNSFEAIAVALPPTPPSISAGFGYDLSELQYHNRLSLFWERPSVAGTSEDGSTFSPSALSYEEGTPWPGEGGRRGLVKVTYQNPFGETGAMPSHFEGWVLPSSAGATEDGWLFYGVPCYEQVRFDPTTLQYIVEHKAIDLHAIVDDFDTLPTIRIGAYMLNDFLLGDPGVNLPAWRLGKYSVDGRLAYIATGHATAPGMRNHPAKTFENGNGSFTAIRAYYSAQRLLTALRLVDPPADMNLWPSLIGPTEEPSNYAGWAHYNDPSNPDAIARHDGTYLRPATEGYVSSLPCDAYVYMREETQGPVWEEVTVSITSGSGAGGGSSPSEGYQTAYLKVADVWTDYEISGDLDGVSLDDFSWARKTLKSWNGQTYTQFEIDPPFRKAGDGSGWLAGQKVTLKIRRQRYGAIGVLGRIYASFWPNDNEVPTIGSAMPPEPGTYDFEAFPASAQ